MVRELQLEKASKEKEFDVLILHYLGLDHIGHFQGANSSLIPSKLQQMDQVISLIHQHVTQFDAERCKNKVESCGTLISVVGDHGMTEGGNHGGSTELETETAVIFITKEHHEVSQSANSQSYYLDDSNVATIQQIDFASSISLLFGLPIPQNNLGHFIPDLFDYLTLPQFIDICKVNGNQLIKLLQANSLFWKNGQPINAQVKELWGEWEDLQQFEAFQNSDKEKYIDVLNSISNLFETQLNDYNVGYLLLGILCYFISSALFLFAFYQHYWLMLVNYVFHTTSFNVFHLLEIFYLFLGNILFFVSLFTSSFIEKENLIWNFNIATFFCIYYVIAHFYDLYYKNQLSNYFSNQCLATLFFYWIATFGNVPAYNSYLNASVVSVVPCFLLMVHYKDHINTHLQTVPICFHQSLRGCAVLIFISLMLVSLLKFQQIAVNYDPTAEFFISQQQITFLTQINYFLLFAMFLLVVFMYRLPDASSDATVAPLSYKFRFHLLGAPLVILMFILQKPCNQWILLLFLINLNNLHHNFLTTPFTCKFNFFFILLIILRPIFPC